MWAQTQWTVEEGGDASTDDTDWSLAKHQARSHARMQVNCSRIFRCTYLCCSEEMHVCLCETPPSCTDLSDTPLPTRSLSRQGKTRNQWNEPTRTRYRDASVWDWKPICNAFEESTTCLRIPQAKSFLLGKCILNFACLLLRATDKLTVEQPTSAFSKTDHRMSHFAEGRTRPLIL